MKAPLRYLVLAAAVLIGGMSLGLSLWSSESGTENTFIGQDSCMTCHEGPYGGPGGSYRGAGPFRQTMHQKIHLRPNPQTVVIDRLFREGRVLRFQETRIGGPPHDTLEIHLSKGMSETDYYIQLKFSQGGDSTPRMKVAYTYGGNGWIQRYLVEVNGNLHVAPFQYVLPRYLERTDTSEGWYFLDLKRWYTLNDDREGQFYSFTSKVFINQSWNNECAYCHVNGFEMKRVVAGTDTTWKMDWVGTKQGDSALIDQNIKIGCESCHGPGSLHAASPTDPAGIISPRRWAPDGQGQFTNLDLKLDLCGQCHNRMRSTGLPTGNPDTPVTAPRFPYPYDEVNQKAYLPGLPLKQFAWKRDIFYGMDVWDDRQLSRAHHQQGQDFIRSGAYEQHVFANGCWSCHTVHYNDTLPYQLRDNYYSLESGDGCLAFGCHDTFDETTTFKGRTVNKHAMHSPEISQCVNCHFTKSATISFVELPSKPYYDFTDHSLRVFRPSMTRLYRNIGILGMPNTCAEACHRNGRGSRNFDPATSPAAPSYGINDILLNKWNDPTDVRLADSLEMGWAEMFPAGVTRESGIAGSTGITWVGPNPAKGSTTVRFTLAGAGTIALAVYDMRGLLVRRIASGLEEPGAYSQAWDLTDANGTQVAAGTYMIRLETKQGVTSERVVVTR